MKVDVTRFWAQVVKTDTCWLWVGRKDRFGYGKFGHQLAHRVAWFLANGSIPDSMNILHECDNPPCIRPGPGHTYLGTQSQNIKDAWERKRRTYTESERKKLVARNKAASRLSQHDVEQIKIAISQGVPQGIVARAFKVSQSYVSRLARGLRR